MADQPASGTVDYTNVPIGQPVADLERHIKFLSMPLQVGPNGEPLFNGFDIEFRFIEKRCEQDDFRTKTYLAADQVSNRSKNRWTNVLPPDDTRVELAVKEGLEGSDYINANYISGEVPGSENQYISTQGPLPGTVGDFWRMIWEQNSKVIVMLTKEFEGGRAKCVKYWPDKDSKIYDDIRVTSDNIDLSSKQVIARHFTLEHLRTHEKRKVVHYQYKEWPDHGLPSSTNAFLHLVHSAKKVNDDGPIVVHCSAGIGRSGTFCAVHALVQKMHEQIDKKGDLPPLNIVETVLNLRDQRPGMVQTKDQYMFCYLAVQEEYLRLRSQVKSK